LKKKKALLVGGGVLGGILLLLVVTVLVALWRFPAERVALLAAAQAEATLDRQVRIDAVRVRILPRLGVSLEGVRVSRQARPGEEATTSFEPLLASLDGIQLRPRLLPLLRGQVIVHEVVVDGPEFYLHIPEGEDTLDLPTFQEEEPATRDVEIEIRRILIRDGLLDYRDANTGTAVVARGIGHDLSLAASVEAGELSLLEFVGRLTVAGIDAELPESLAAPLRGLTLVVEHEAALHPVDDRLELRRTQVTLQDFPLGVVGRVEALSREEARTVSLRAFAEGVDAARLMASLPPELLEALPRGPDGADMRGTAGRVDLDASAEGRAGGGERPEVDGLLRLDGVALGFGNGRGEDLFSNLRGTLSFSLDSMATEEFQGRLLGEPFQVTFALRNPAEPEGTFQGRGTLDLAALGPAGLLPTGHETRGSIAFDLLGRGGMADPSAASLAGELVLEGVHLRLADLHTPVEVAQGRIDLQGQAAVTRDLRIALGRSDLALDLEARGWLARALGDEGVLPGITFLARSTLLDMDQVLDTDPEAIPYGQLFFAQMGDRPIEGRTASEIARELELELPEIPALRLDGRVRAQTMVSGGLTYGNLEALLVSRGEGELQVPSAVLEVMGGRIEASALLGPPEAVTEGEGAPRPLHVDYTVSDVTADPFLHHHTLFRGRVGGRLRLTGSAEMELGADLLPDRETMVGAGTVAILDGELRDWPLVREFARTVGAPALPSLAFSHWEGRYRILGPWILLEEGELEAGELAVRSTGSFDVGGNLDLRATFHLPRTWLARIPGAPTGALAGLPGDEAGRIPIGARVGGTTASPSITLDFSEAGAIAADRAREEAQAEVRRQAERLRDRLGIGRWRLETAPPPDTLPPPPDILPAPDTAPLPDTVPSGILSVARLVVGVTLLR